MKAWHDKLHCERMPQIKMLDKDAAGMKAGMRMYISTPLELDSRIRVIPSGECVSVAHLRLELAQPAGADVTCPLTTGIFLRIVAEAAWEAHVTGQSLDTVTPFWRVIEAASPLARKFACPPDFIARMRSEERP